MNVFDIETKQFDKAFHLSTLVDGGGLNGNRFGNLKGFDDNYFIYIEDTGTSEITGNTFRGIQFQPKDGTNTHVIYINDGDGNIFTGVIIWDWAGDGDTAYSVNITSGSDGNMIQGTYGLSLAALDDAGANTVFIEDDAQLFPSLYGSENVKIYNASDYGTILGTSDGLGLKIECNNGKTYISYESGSQVSFYESADNGEHNAVEIWGNGGTLENINFKWDVDGIIDTSVGGGNISLTPDGGQVNITGDLNVSGKIGCVGGVDPPYVLFNKETILDVITRINDEVPKYDDQKWDGQAIFYDGEEDNMFLYNPNSGDTREFVWKSDFDVLEQRITELEAMMEILMNE